MSDVSEKLAAAGFAPLEGLTMWHRCENGLSVGEWRGCALRWDIYGVVLNRETQSHPDLVPLPAPPQEPERLSDKEISDKLARDLIESRGVIGELREQVATLMKERDALREEVDTVRGMNRNQARLIDDLQKVAQIAAIERHNLERSIDLQHDQIGHQAKACEEAEKDRDGFRDEANRLRVMLRDVEHGRHAARELCRRMRDSLIGPGATPENVRLVVEFDALDKVANSGHPAPAEAATGELVPWNAETRPRGVVWIRHNDRPEVESIVQEWGDHGFSHANGYTRWEDALLYRMWSRDGITWQRCGTVRETGVPQ